MYVILTEKVAVSYTLDRKWFYFQIPTEALLRLFLDFSHESQIIDTYYISNFYL